MKHDRALVELSAPLVPVISAAYPFYAREPKCYAVLEGLTLAEIVARDEHLPAGFFEHGVVELIALDKSGRCVSRKEIGPAHWHLVTPRVSRGVDLTVALRLPLKSGGGGGQKKNPFQVVALVAVIALSFAVSGGALTPAILGATGINLGAIAFGTTSYAALAGAGIGLIGLVAISALSKPPALPSQNPAQSNQAHTAALQGNVLSPNTPLPRIAGTKRIAPPALMEPFIEDVGDDQYAECIYALAGPHKVWDVRCDMLPSSQIKDGQVEIRQGKSTDPLFKGFVDPRTGKRVLRYAHTETPNITLSQHRQNKQVHTTALSPNVLDFGYRYFEEQRQSPLGQCPQWHSFTKTIDCDETHITLSAPAGWAWADNTTDQLVGIPFRMRLRSFDSSGRPGAWRNLPEFWLGRNQPAGFNFTVKLFWRLPGKTEMDTPTPPGDDEKGAVYVYTSVPSCNYASADAAALGFDSWTASSTFMSANPTASNRLYSEANINRSNIKNCRAYDDRIEFFLDPRVFEPGTYEIAIVRGCEVRVGDPTDGTDPRFDPSTYYRRTDKKIDIVNTFFGYHKTVFDSLGTTRFPFYAGDEAGAFASTVVSRIAHVILEQPSPSKDVCVIAVKVKNRSIGVISANCAGLVPDWNGSNWTGLVTSSNPATQARAILTGPLNLSPIGPESINDDDFHSFRTRCIGSGTAANPDFQVNAEITGLSVPAAFDLIAGCGFGGGRFAETYGVTWDRDRSAEGVTAIFTPRSSRQFSFSKGFPPLPGGLRVLFSDKTNDYLDKAIFVYAEGNGGSQDIEEVRYQGLVTDLEARRRAKYDLRHPRDRAIFYTFNVPAQHVYCRKGDLIGLQHDVLLTSACYARLVSKTIDTGNITELTVDDAFSTAIGLPTGTSGVTNFPNTTFGIALEWADGTVTIHRARLSDDDAKVIELITPFTNDSDIKAGIQVTGGSIGQEFLRLIVTKIVPKDDDTADITAYDEANGLLV